MGTEFYIETDTDTLGDRFRQSAGGTAMLLTWMGEFGMLIEGDPAHRPYLAEFDLSPDDFDGPVGDGKIKPAKAQAFAAAQEAARQRLESYDPSAAGIPRYKVDSNEGWLIAPQEITAALAAYDSHPAAERRDAERSGYCDWPGWIAFLRRAVASGIRVY
ncbi:hypothetical protein AB0D10_01195 [Kitasatospora sp. NPDC048545]|uniref:hypothetical protein n=1 Tax=Kitasatospora sp. NPDC048545 TaxID=3157208 RepID=UPI0033C5F474